MYDDLDRCAKPLAQALLEQVDLGAWGNTLARHVPYGAKEAPLVQAWRWAHRTAGWVYRASAARCPTAAARQARCRAGRQRTPDLMALVHSLTRRDQGAHPQAVLYTERTTWMPCSALPTRSWC